MRFDALVERYDSGLPRMTSRPAPVFLAVAFAVAVGVDWVAGSDRSSEIAGAASPAFVYDRAASATTGLHALHESAFRAYDKRFSPSLSHMFASLPILAEKAGGEAAGPAGSLTRAGIRRTNPADWRRTRDLWDRAGYEDILSEANRAKIAAGRTPFVDEAWVRYFPGDKALMGEKIPCTTSGVARSLFRCRRAATSMLTSRVAIATTLEARVLPAEIIERYDRRSTLLCYPESEADDEVSPVVASWHRDLLAVDHDWSIALPEFIDERYEDDRTVGVAIQLLPPVDREGAPMPRALDAQMLADAETLVAAAAEFTRDNDLELAFELDGLVVGWVEGGVVDRQLVEGLLRPWRDRVGAA